MIRMNQGQLTEPIPGMHDAQRDGVPVAAAQLHPEATRLGMNLGWLQVSLTEKEQASSLGVNLAK